MQYLTGGITAAEMESLTTSQLQAIPTSAIPLVPSDVLAVSCMMYLKYCAYSHCAITFNSQTILSKVADDAKVIVWIQALDETQLGALSMAQIETITREQHEEMFAHQLRAIVANGGQRFISCRRHTSCGINITCQIFCQICIFMHCRLNRSVMYYCQVMSPKMNDIRCGCTWYEMLSPIDKAAVHIITHMHCVTHMRTSTVFALQVQWTQPC